MGYNDNIILNSRKGLIIVMKILVAVKRVIDFKTAVRIKTDGTAVETTNVKMAMNPFDEIAVEEALRIKEKSLAEEIIVVSIGTDQCQETIRTALAMGADRGVLVKIDSEIQPLAAAKILAAITQQEQAGLVILGKQAIDTDDNQVGQMLAGLLGWAQGTFASQVSFHDQGVSVTREVDGGMETDILTLPAVITTDLRLNEPRYISLPNIVRAKQKSIAIITADTLNLDLAPRIKVLNIAMSKKSRTKIRVSDVAELVKCLKQDAQVIS